MSSDKVKKVETKLALKHSVDKLVSIVRKAYREFVNQKVQSLDNRREKRSFPIEWSDILSYVCGDQLLIFASRIPEKSEILWEMLDDVEIASLLVRSGAKLDARKLGDDSGSSFLHVLSSSSDPKKHELALLMIKHGANVNDCDAERKTVLYVAVRNEVFSIVEAILKRNEWTGLPFKYYFRQSEIPIGVAMRSSNFAIFMKLFKQFSDHDMGWYCGSLPWDMSDDHLLAVVKTLLSFSDQTYRSDAECILSYVSWKSLKLAKLLFSCRNNETERWFNLQSLLSYDFILKKFSLLVFLIREGANINDCVNEDKQYPLHVACKLTGPKTVQLLLKLEADVNVTNRFGETPFSLCIDQRDDSVTTLMMKHFALLTCAGIKINEKDLSTIRREQSLQRFYKSCIEELIKAKTFEPVDGFKYYYFFSKTIYELLRLTTNTEAFMQLRRSLLILNPNAFPIYKGEMMKRVALVRKMRSAIFSRERELEQVFSGILPCIVIREIARYSLNLVNFEKEYYMSCVE